MRAHLRCSNHRVRCPQPNPPPRSAWPPERRARALQRSTHTQPTDHARVTTRARRTARTGTRRRRRFKKWTQFKKSVFIRTRGLHACTCTCTCTCTGGSTGGRRAGPGPSTTLHTNTTSHHGATPIGCPKQERRRRPTQQKGVDKKKCCARQGAGQASTWHLALHGTRQRPHYEHVPRRLPQQQRQHQLPHPHRRPRASQSPHGGTERPPGRS
jgi:hypothetical protein